ncbi:hypothetical protein XA3_13910 [Xylocopilactobacillus apicola]|uniref:Uncharacterized protein n=1 Tax=Xylocopilactobacillus apicola TaxID=2932184 RepID=A0AAU9DG74_9LACO|nr:hypothetical protein XA3_13910 [Xylocopilactobacillus apicola]
MRRIRLKSIFHNNPVKKIKIKYQHQSDTQKFINSYFEKRRIKADCVDSEFNRGKNQRVYSKTFMVKVPQSMSCAQIIEEISLYRNIIEIRRIKK